MKKVWELRKLEQQLAYCVSESEWKTTGNPFFKKDMDYRLAHIDLIHSFLEADAPYSRTLPAPL